ncbi:helix-turn-helix domain-containing protein [Micromonospora sp. NPDC005161]
MAANCGVHRSTVHRWVGRYLTEQLAGLADRSHRPHSSPGQVAEAVEVAVAEMRREHPRWGSRRIRLEMLRRPGPWAVEDLVVPSERTIDRILQRQGLLRVRPRNDRRTRISGGNGPPRCSCGRWTSSVGCSWSTRPRVCCGRRSWSPRSTTTPGTA